MRKKNSGLFAPFIFLIILILMVCFPNTSYNAAKRGVDIWFNNVFPALLPFFIGTEILTGLGIVHFLGALLEPIMYPIFNIPGVGSFAYAMSITSGYPMGAKITAELRDKGLCSREEGQRLLALCSTSGPLFMIGAVAIGMFNDATLGIMIMLSHYIGSIFTGIIFRNYGSKKNLSSYNKKTSNLFDSIRVARKEDGRKLGELLGDAVKNSINTLLIIGGFIILFSVIIELSLTIKLLDFLALAISPLFHFANASSLIIKGLLSGLVEITNGVNIISQTTDSIMLQGVLTSFIIAWGGLSIHAQAISLISKTDLKVLPYLVSKILHGLFSGISCYYLMRSLFPYFQKRTVPTFLGNNAHYFPQLTWYNKLLLSLNFCISILSILILVGFSIYVYLKFKYKIKKIKKS
ncbi:sporulation integral membrane protein YlbJ [Irregularibacter muris]|uniref:Sporulation integral membrane protein YlbJ n=1 Tax=Irregularibacter muris TaxID=1796619 RepID=A0AAE3L296_9FIRM|nr:sporulation integral membrane protein YlbJ [Irregularibacter muris]MCR1898154.1 sporulation integral membrane protein YlbJ [Irregularibacter muris]